MQTGIAQARQEPSHPVQDAHRRAGRRVAERQIGQQVQRTGGQHKVEHMLVERLGDRLLANDNQQHLFQMERNVRVAEVAFGAQLLGAAGAVRRGSAVAATVKCLDLLPMVFKVLQCRRWRSQLDKVDNKVRVRLAIIYLCRDAKRWLLWRL